MGHVTPGYEIAVVDKDTRQLCAEGDTGELWCAAPVASSCSSSTTGTPKPTRTPSRTAGSRPATWCAWGRAATSSIERDKDLLKVGGENVSAKEVEDLVVSHPAVQQAAVVGKQHDFLGEVPVVFVIAAPGEHDESAVSDEIIKLCKDSLATFKVPCAVYYVESFPTGTLDKLLKNKLRAGRRATAGVLT